MLNRDLFNAINSKLIDYIMRFPFPYIDILREQISACEVTNEWYSDCYTIHFHQKGKTRHLPRWLPSVPQGCQVIKESGPISCQLYIESGHIVQFEVVDMGMNEIDWDYLWSHKPIFDVEYDFQMISNFLTGEKMKISKLQIGKHHIYMKVARTKQSHTVCMWDCNILSSDLLNDTQSCYMELCLSPKADNQYLLKFDNIPIISCSLICLQDGLII